MTNLFIFSNDLRLKDNQALYEASINSKALQAVFIFSPKKWDTHNESHLKIKFQIKNLEILKKELQNLNINLKILFSDNIEDEPKVIAQEALRVKANNVFIRVFFLPRKISPTRIETGCNKKLQPVYFYKLSLIHI